MTHIPVGRVLALWSAFALISGCQGSSDDLERPDVSHIDLKTEIRRFERDLFRADTLRMDTERARLDSLYGEFATVFFGHILMADDSNIAPEGAAEYIRGFITHATTRHLYDTIQVVYPDLKREQDAFDQAFRYLKFYFPHLPPPRITTFLSEFSVGNFIYGEDELAVGLDLYLGQEYPYATVDPTNPIFSGYLTRTYNRDHLVPRTLKPLLEDLVGPPAGERLIDHMIRNGKVLYLQQLILPAIPDSARLEFSPEQLEWLRDNERDIWAYFTSENLLFSNDWKKVRKYVEYSPHSPGMPPEAPGRTGDWIGLQMVKAFLKRQPQAGPAELLQWRDSQRLLEASGYKPRR